MIQTALAHHGEGASHTLSHSILSSEHIVIGLFVLVGIGIAIYLTTNK